MPYCRDKAIAYAHRWAYGRNPRYYNFDGQGGDCTNFISQCLYAGGGVMNYTRDTGWYYASPSERAAAWSGVPFLHSFLTGNTGPGPYGHEASLSEAVPGDIIQLCFDGKDYGHSLFVVGAGAAPAPDNILVATHTFNSDNRPLSGYAYAACRLIHIGGVRK